MSHNASKENFDEGLDVSTMSNGIEDGEHREAAFIVAFFFILLMTFIGVWLVKFVKTEIMAYQMKWKRENLRMQRWREVPVIIHVQVIEERNPRENHRCHG